MHSDATQADREKLNRGKSPYYPEISASLSVSLPNLMQKQEHEIDDFLILKKRKRNKKEKREKNKLTNNYLILKLKKNIIYYIYFSRFCG